jgi:hypothetical protein
MRRGKEESESSQPAQTLHLATGSSNGLFGAKRLTLRAALKGGRRRCTPPSNALAREAGRVRAIRSNDRTRRAGWTASEAGA